MNPTQNNTPSPVAAPDRLASIEQKIDAMSKTVKRLNFYFMMTVFISIAAILLPAIGLIWAIPQFINTYATPLQGN